ncbi:hypothetical protein CRUP_022383, partial [Coryphaenoides rupestris]
MGCVAPHRIYRFLLKRAAQEAGKVSNQVSRISRIPGVAVLEGPMYAVGGHDGWSYLSTVESNERAVAFCAGATSIEQYCLRRDSWSQVATMSGRRLQFGVAVLDGRLHVVGGRDGLKTLNTGPMYAVGGHDGWSYLSTVERWDPQARVWSFISSMSTPRSTVGLAVLNG